MTLAAIVLLPFLLAWLPLVANRAGRAACAWAAAAVTAASLACLVALAPRVLGGETIAAGVAWLPWLGFNLTLMLDGFGLLFALLILVIGLLVILFSAYYLAPEDPTGRFFAFLLLFMGSMLGIVLSDNLLLLVVFWELTSLASFLLIGYWRHRADAREGARMALVVTGGGGLAMLGGIVLLGQIAGTYELSELLAMRDTVQSDPLFPAALVLILLGAFTKSAQFPFHFWLPHAMAAPTPVSAYLHSATMVKAGVFLLARLYPLLGGNDLWFFLVSGTGLLTLTFAAYVALFQHDLKGLLAYSTISHLGLVTLLFGLDTPLAVVAGVFHIINHATFKASLFMVAGIVDHEAGSRDMRRLGGLWRHMPVTATLAMVAAAAMAGVPLLNGFLSKEMFLAETLLVEGRASYDLLVPFAAMLAGMFGVAYSLRFIHNVFFNGEPHGLVRTPHEPPRWMRVPVELLVLVCLVVGLAPALTVGPLLAAAAQAVLQGEPPEYRLAIWHGFDPSLAMSAVALAGGVAIYFLLQRFYGLHRYVAGGLHAKPLFESALSTLSDAAGALTAAVQNASLQRYLVLLMLAALVAGYSPFLGGGMPWGGEPLTPVDAASFVVWLLLVAATLAATICHARRLFALLATGAVGLVVSLAFVRFSAPDLALTQLSVEVVTMLLVILALHWLPSTTPAEGARLRQWRDAAIAACAGFGVAALAFAAMTRPFNSISYFFLEKTVPEGGGANTVNVILVDFRGFDTLGEILVLAIAGLTVHALLADFRVPGAYGRPFRPAADRHPLLLALVARTMLPFLLMVALYLFLRGHNQPGGGFVAGLVASIALLVQYLGGGLAWTDRRLPVRFDRVIAWGIVAAGVTGIGSWVVGYPFLTSTTPYLDLPVLGKVPVASAMFFDLGVLLTVLGSTLLMLTPLARLAPDGAAGRTAGERA